MNNDSAGKTTLMKRLAQEIPNWERTLTIEDTEELRLKTLYPEKHIVECRPTDKEETNIDLSKLLESALRMYPTRIIVGEVR
jgi:pilus assembly protein CpaF